MLFTMNCLHIDRLIPDQTPENKWPQTQSWVEEDNQRLSTTHKEHGMRGGPKNTRARGLGKDSCIGISFQWKHFSIKGNKVHGTKKVILSQVFPPSHRRLYKQKQKLETETFQSIKSPASHAEAPKICLLHLSSGLRRVFGDTAVFYPPFIKQQILFLYNII